MEWSDRELHEAGIVTMRRRINELPVAQLSGRAEVAGPSRAGFPGADSRQLKALERKVAELQKAVSQRDALINLYQQRVEALTAEVEGRKRGPFRLFR
ncbi:MAG: hypothetical protein FJZ00_14605 [Candidatus Sericytochromatia bacterium]|uniref:Uncharacterized protein n=1 Tax=Candidatus Tanganyikabacteria bacterium TaxID=2961651 RepID=A0A937X7W9_9BACT|nr:hypothetical protein [Candidatus Tanganyikabacteria bacterium]